HPLVSERAREASEHQAATDQVRYSGLFQLMLVNTRTGEIRPLVNAPSSINSSSASVVWSSDSRSAVVAGTLLPLDTPDAQELARRKAGPFVAAVDIASGRITTVLAIPRGEGVEIARTVWPNTFLLSSWHVESSGDLAGKIPSRMFALQGGVWQDK